MNISPSEYATKCFTCICIQGLINKPNRKLVAGACLMLAAKLNDVKGPEITKLIQVQCISILITSW